MNRDMRYNRSQGSSMMSMAQANPEALLVIAAGLTMMMRSKTRSSAAQRAAFSGSGRVRRSSDYGSAGPSGASSAIGSTIAGATEAAKDAFSATKDTAAQYAGAASETAIEYVDSAKEYLGSAADYAGSAQDYVTDRVSRAWSDVTSGSEHMLDRVGEFADYSDRAVRSHPVATAALGLAIGATLAALIPSSRLEDDALAGTREALGEAAQDAKNRLYDAADQAWQEARRLAEEKGVDAQGLKTMVQQVSDKFAQTAKETGSSSAPATSSSTSPTSPSHIQGQVI